MSDRDEEDLEWADEPCSSCGETEEVSYDMYDEPLCHACFDEAWL
jgi:formylmethanofuran dehydrogenase subunit E